jgi:hypothetical protein
MEQMEEQRAFYMWAERRGGANPDRAGLNRKRQRTCTETTYVSVANGGARYACPTAQGGDPCTATRLNK